MIGGALEAGRQKGTRPMRDLVVVLPGITGSTLSHRGARRDTRVWDFSAETMCEFLATRGERILTLSLPEHDPRSEPPETAVTATGLISGFHGIYGLGRIAGYGKLGRELVRRLGLIPGNFCDSRPANFLEFAYDWRLSSRHNAVKLRDAVDRKLVLWRESSGEPGAKVIFIAHSMGGLLARYYLEVTGDDEIRGDGQWRKCRALFTFGTPFRGSVNAVNYVANGYKKMFLDLTEVVRSCPSIYELMSVYPAIEHAGEWFRPSEVQIPNASHDYVSAARDFHNEIKVAIARHRSETAYLEHGYRTFPFVGVGQSTFQSARLKSQVLTISKALPFGIDPLLEGGDGTVPRLSATPIEMSTDHRESFIGEQHGFLHSNVNSLDDLLERLKQIQSRGLMEIQGWGQSPLRYIDVSVDDLFFFDEPVLIRARVNGSDLGAHRLVVDVARIEGQGAVETSTYELKTDATWQEVELQGLKPGQYRITVRQPLHVIHNPERVHASFEILGKSGEGR